MNPTDDTDEPAVTTDHGTIREWVESAGSVPVLDSDGADADGPAVRDREAVAQGTDASEADWESFFQAFEERDLALYRTGDGTYEVVDRSTAADRLNRPLDEVTAALDGGGTATRDLGGQDEGTPDPNESIGTERPAGERDQGEGTPAETRRPNESTEEADEAAGEGSTGDAAAEQVPAENVDTAGAEAGEATGTKGTTSRATERTKDATVREDAPEESADPADAGGVEVEGERESASPESVPTSGRADSTPDDPRDDGNSAVDDSAAVVEESPTDDSPDDEERERSTDGDSVAPTADAGAEARDDGPNDGGSAGGDTRSDPDSDETENAASPDATMAGESGSSSDSDSDAEGASSVDPDAEREANSAPDAAGTNDVADDTDLSGDDVGKGVFDGDGAELGIVVGADEGGPLRVESDPGLTDRLRGVVGWGRDDEDDDWELDRSAVERIESDRVVVDADATPSGSAEGVDE
ncbi:hypothetical protein ACFO0N_09725 [Halobium salinum]|uniref:Uncharacterized protein n=1 Tax=Halobium salinum TaxID=1364940 RepID=A0ABD5PC58_9EURY|nr:hypothetical protein [Halobium salinum]